MINIISHYKRALLVLSTTASVGTMVFMAPLTHATTCRQSLWGIGSSGSCVKDIQSMLNIEGNDIRWNNWSNLSADGQFGPLTKGQVQAFQAWSGLQQDGIVGPNTWGELCSTSLIVVDDLNNQGLVKTANALQAIASEAGC